MGRFAARSCRWIPAHAAFLRPCAPSPLRPFFFLLLALLPAACGKNQPDAADVAANNRGVGLMGQFDYAKAYDAFAALVAEHPDWNDVKVNLAIAALNRQQEGDEARALDLLQQVIAADPGNVRARYGAGLLLYRTADEAALDHLRFVAGKVHDDAYAAYFYGSALEQAGDTAGALIEYERALALDPYLRSAYYRVSRILLRSGRSEDGLALQDQFQKLADNPRARTVDFVYTKMGELAEAMPVDLAEPVSAPPPKGPVFAESKPLLGGGAEPRWNDAPRRPATVTAGDLDGDGRDDLLITGAMREQGAVNAVVINGGSSGFALDLQHPLAGVTDVNAALWGDYDNDGRTDVYLCRAGPNALWRQTGPGQWSEVTGATGTAGGGFDTVDGALFDADHDGDLDLFCVNADGPNELLNNNLDGTFRPIAGELGIAGDGRPSRQVVVADLDHDRDVDIVVLNLQPPNEVYINDRLWSYRRWEDAAITSLDVRAAVAGDLDADGRFEVYLTRADGSPARWDPDGNAVAPAAALEVAGGSTDRLGICDFDGDGVRELQALGPWWPVVLEPATGPALVARPPEDMAVIRPPGPGRHLFAALAFSGMEDPGQSMRSNASGVGARVAVRVDSRWTAFETFRHDSGPGQSHQPVAVGLGGQKRIDFVAIDWSDGVFQTELNLAGGELHSIRETQRQVSSCPVLFAWNGSRYEFVSDLLGVGGIGYMVAPGEYSVPRPWENFMLPQGLPVARDGRMEIKIGEPMEEACYLDSARLVAYDLPPGWSMTLDERMGILGPDPTGEPRFYRRLVKPIAATSAGGDVTALIAEADLDPAPVGELDLRFIGRLLRPNVVTLTFDRPLEGQPGEPLLLADGWIEYPYSQTMFGAWQAGAEYVAPTLEARGADGAWHVVLEQFGYPAGMPRQMSVPLPDLPAGTTQLRLTTNQEIYWDRLAIAFAEPCPEVRRQALATSSADVRRSGFARRTTGPQRQPHYDYDDRSPFWDTRHQPGAYTAFGPALELVAHTDDAVAIFGPGEEVHLSCVAPEAPPQPGWTRRYVLEARGWCKDMDLFTKDGETVGPVPGNESDARRALQDRYNTRYEAGK